jgi:hypothetical protein
VIVDTDVLIWYMRGNLKAAQALGSLKDFSISVVTHIELVQGMRNKRELNLLLKFLKNREVKTFQISEEISSKAQLYVEQHFLSHAVTLADALIAATCVVHGSPVLTSNDKHYTIIKGVRVHKFVP